ncbi:TRAP transporter small permease [Arenibaculum sp.]|uniref:TRAP transporter small permease n=1 Tax=Arenibaculum sp. TaxID=2865862 RepID=UPI002E12D4A0|nr:TRAP transporter small permease subunit [Arenibaculum sp.]
MPEPSPAANGRLAPGPAEGRHLAVPAAEGRPAPVRLVERLFQAVCVLAIAAMCLVTCWDVLFRYVFAQPLPWSQEAIQFLMALLFFAGLPVATLHRQHIVVDVVSARFRGRGARIAGLAANLLSCAFAALLSFFSVQFALKLMAYGDRTPWLGLPWHLATWAAAVAFAAAALVWAAHARTALRGAST